MQEPGSTPRPAGWAPSPIRRVSWRGTWSTCSRTWWPSALRERTFVERVSIRVIMHCIADTAKPLRRYGGSCPRRQIAEPPGRRSPRPSRRRPQRPAAGTPAGREGGPRRAERGHATSSAGRGRGQGGAQALRPPTIKRAVITGAVLAFAYFALIEWGVEERRQHQGERPPIVHPVLPLRGRRLRGRDVDSTGGSCAN